MVCHYRYLAHSSPWRAPPDQRHPMLELQGSLHLPSLGRSVRDEALPLVAPVSNRISFAVCVDRNAACAESSSSASRNESSSSASRN